MTKLALMCTVLIGVSSWTSAGGQTLKADMPDSANNTTSATTCKGENFHIGLAPPLRCCQAGRDLFHISTSLTGLAHRRLGRACTIENGTSISTNCGVGSTQECTFGSCGAAKADLLGEKDTHVFRPTSKPKVCGYQTTTAQNEVIFYPERYLHQTLYPKVTATCPYTICLVGGRPAVTLNVTAVADTATGRVKSDPTGISLSGAGTASATFEGIITLTAQPKGSHARALFSGGCAKTGQYGEKAECTVKLAPDPEVTVTYECQAGFTCERGNKD